MDVFVIKDTEGNYYNDFSRLFGRKFTGQCEGFGVYGTKEQAEEEMGRIVLKFPKLHKILFITQEKLKNITYGKFLKISK
jgi:hypothetical protein